MILIASIQSLEFSSHNFTLEDSIHDRNSGHCSWWRFNNYPQQNQIAINKNQIKVKDFHTLIIQAAGRFTSTWFPKRTDEAFLTKDLSLLILAKDIS